MHGYKQARRVLFFNLGPVEEGALGTGCPALQRHGNRVVFGF